MNTQNEPRGADEARQSYGRLVKFAFKTCPTCDRPFDAEPSPSSITSFIRSIRRRFGSAVDTTWRLLVVSVVFTGVVMVFTIPLCLAIEWAGRVFGWE